MIDRFEIVLCPFLNTEGVFENTLFEVIIREPRQNRTQNLQMDWFCDARQTYQDHL